ncbi:MAG: porin [Pseudotabrizicola sp.]|uniref:porin n=1 Tax=Pseudotabrizicola sp. TaxID=2939647 RepID=UPI002721A04B|nr:porin [Pseudotabrizicola sp.]MDO9639024.1 porin [Pseudotabrizicola sp.]
MKKVLLASTVLAMTATVAAADVTVSGSARMGVAYNSEAVNKLGFTSRVRVAFGLSGETDTGLAFGASIRADNSGAGNNGVARATPAPGTGSGDVNGAGNQAAGSVFVSGAFGKLSMGDVDGAAELVTGDLAGVGLTGLGDLNESAFLSNTDAVRRSAARYEYSTGGLTFAVSADNPQNDAAALENVYSIGVKYSVDAYAFGLGYETSDVNGVSVDHIIASGEATFSGITLKAVYGEADDFGGIAGNDFTQYGISAKYSMDALSVTAFHRVAETGVRKDKFTGIGASYALGGGASVVGGLVDVNYGLGGPVDQTRADLGLSFSF